MEYIVKQYRATKVVRKVGKKTSFISLDCEWGFKPGDLVDIIISRAGEPVQGKDADDTGIEAEKAD